MNKIAWFTGISNSYYNQTFSKVFDTWNLIKEDVYFFSDDTIIALEYDTRNILSPILEPSPKKLKDLEIKFWKKSRSTINGLKKLSANYDIAIWLDADVKILKCPVLDTLLPAANQLLSANSKIPDKGTSMDTGFVAFNLRHKDFQSFLFEYENFWNTEKLENLPFRYDAPVVENILESNNYDWKNLWYGTITHHKKEGKHYCGFQDSDLEKYFYHYWGKFKRKIDD